MNPANYKEAPIETEADEDEGADILLVKPAMPCLDVVWLLLDNSALPIAAYQVAGEYSMIKAGGAYNMVGEEKVMMESLLCIRQAGADIALSYFPRKALSNTSKLVGEDIWQQHRFTHVNNQSQEHNAKGSGISEDIEDRFRGSGDSYVAGDKGARTKVSR
uniref:porphobilinogen synthase n=1 Tax=Elaeis guineensis var. tenera TaxID=51953 RepID=A0A8N4I5B7_ELAGV|nr:delta-aminolevulinic acid dehydratase, chloroplastic-like [Elaeis guineensis]